MDVPWQQLQPETLDALVQEFITREGTDYGRQEVSFETKVDQVKRLLSTGQARIVFDQETQSCDIREALRVPQPHAIARPPS